MPWRVSYSDDLDAVVTVYSGVLPVDALRAAVEATLTLARQRAVTRFLADCSGLQGGHSIGDLYDLANLLETLGVDRGAREAIVLPQLNAPAADVRFWETVCLNRGFTVRVFETMPQAAVWLAGEAERDDT